MVKVRKCLYIRDTMISFYFSIIWGQCPNSEYLMERKKTNIAKEIGMKRKNFNSFWMDCKLRNWVAPFINLDIIQFRYKIYSMNRNILFICLLIFTTSAIRLAHEVKYAWYTRREEVKNRCTISDQCDGQRGCIGGLCQGIARPAKNADYYYDEKITGSQCPKLYFDPNLSNKDYYCDGQRTCSSDGLCQGTARPKTANYYYTEAVTGSRCPFNTLDQNYAKRDFFCDGNRTCSPFGWCQGTAR